MIRQGDAGSIVQIIVGRFGPNGRTGDPRERTERDRRGVQACIYESSREWGARDSRV
jgi:hypothetical protein